jgi:exodeoxyribonuclease III
MVVTGDPPPGRGQPATQNSREVQHHTKPNCKSVRRTGSISVDSGHPVVLAGDYNVVPTDEDIYNPRSWLDNALLQPQSRECFRRLLEQGWTDALRHIYGDQRIYTYWDYLRRQRGEGFGLRIDHLLLSSAVHPRLRDAGVDSWVRNLPNASDHAPAWIEVSPAKRAGRRAR